MYEIQRMTTRQRDEEQTGTYRELIGIAEEVVESARMAFEKTGKTRGKDMSRRHGHRRNPQGHRALL